MNKNVLGIDLGTSSVKVLQKFYDGRTQRIKKSYSEISCKGWWDAVCEAVSQLDLTQTVAIGLSSQVGTYIVNGSDVISWNSGVGAEEVREIKKTILRSCFCGRSPWITQILRPIRFQG